MEFIQIKAEYAENQARSGGVSAIQRSGAILENIRRMFLLSAWVTGTWILTKNILRMFSRIRPAELKIVTNSVHLVIWSLWLGETTRKKIQNQQAKNNLGFFSPGQYGVKFFELTSDEFVCIKWHTASVFFSIFKEVLA